MMYKIRLNGPLFKTIFRVPYLNIIKALIELNKIKVKIGYNK